MAAHGKSKRRGAAVEHENEERWLLTYADMLTLLFALFMVLFSISSVNISKYQVLQQSLKAAFSGSILPGGKSIMRSGSESTTAHTPATAEVPSIVPLTPSENSLLYLLAANAGRNVSLRDLREMVWGISPGTSDGAIERRVAGLRQRLRGLDGSGLTIQRVEGGFALN